MPTNSKPAIKTELQENKGDTKIRGTPYILNSVNAYDVPLFA